MWRQHLHTPPLKLAHHEAVVADKSNSIWAQETTRGLACAAHLAHAFANLVAVLILARIWWAGRRRLDNVRCPRPIPKTSKATPPLLPRPSRIRGRRSHRPPARRLIGSIHPARRHCTRIIGSATVSAGFG